MRTIPDRPLERALLLTWVMHILAMVSMALLLVPGLPGGGGELADRMTYVADNPWLWRLGWLPWQLTALANLLLSIALLRTRWIPRLPAWLSLLFLIGAIVPEQIGELLYSIQGPIVARSGDHLPYAALEERLFPLISVWGAALYAVAAVFWSLAFAGARTWRWWLTPFSAGLWLFFGYVSAGLLLPEPWRPSHALVAVGNGVAFVLLMVWFTVVMELVFRRSRPDQAHGRLRPWVHPEQGWTGFLLSLLANSRVLRTLCERLPVPAMQSDVTDVIYVNWVVPAIRLAHLVPEGLELQRFGPGGRYAFFTFLTFRHGHFGPALLAGLRRYLPSPVQSNWRIYVRDPRTGKLGVYLVSNAIDSVVHALGARIFSEGMPMHLLREAKLSQSNGRFELTLDPGSGSAPEAHAWLRRGDARPEAGPWKAAFSTYDEMLAYCVPQDRAFSVQPWLGRVTRQEIVLGIPLAACEPMEGEVHAPAAARIVGNAEPFCFRVPAVQFRFEGERYDPLG